VTAIKVGDKFILSDARSPEYPATVVAVTDVPSGTYVTFKYSRSEEGLIVDRVTTLTQDQFLLRYKKAPSFFRAGRVYQYKRDTERRESYYIEEIYRLPNPVIEDERECARALGVYPSGKQFMRMLNARDFRVMKEETEE
jgi:hypothetical protein